MIRVGIAGIGGRMGRTLAAVAMAEPDLVLVGGSTRPGSAADHAGFARLMAPETNGIVTDDPHELAAAVDVLIDFTTPEGALAHACACVRAERAFVTGVTGFDPNQVAELAEFAQRIPVFTAANFSLGIAALQAVLPRLVRLLAGYDLALVETHHRNKRDAPSGTALELARVMADAAAGPEGERPAVDIHALRLGGAPGEQRVLFAGEAEEITLGHRAFDRRVYAVGAVAAARYVYRRPAGLYGMDDLIAARGSTGHSEGNVEE